MTLQTTGAITLANIQTEFGGADPISMSEYYAGGNGGTVLVPSGTSGTNGAVPTSGQISFSQFYGTSNTFVGIYSYSYTTPGTRNITAPALPPGWPSISASVWLVGGGGGGGGGAASPAPSRDPAASGGGGGAGADRLYVVNSVTPGAAVSVIVGDRGIGGTYSQAANPYTPAADGVNGGNTTVNGVAASAITVAGGTRGGGGNHGTDTGGSGGSGEDPGRAGAYIGSSYVNGGAGGSSYGGVGGAGGLGQGGTVDSNGQTAAGFGAGGGGGGADQTNNDTFNGTPGTGGAGYSGRARVVFYNPNAPYDLTRGSVAFTTNTTWVVPAGVTQIRVVAWGAGGAGNTNAPGGGGATVRADVTVTPGDTLAIRVGGGGGRPAGGTNGGGTAYDSTSAGGGGYTGVFQSNSVTQANTLVIAGGGTGGFVNSSASLTGGGYATGNGVAFQGSAGISKSLAGGGGGYEGGTGTTGGTSYVISGGTNIALIPGNGAALNATIATRPGLITGQYWPGSTYGYGGATNSVGSQGYLVIVY